MWSGAPLPDAHEGRCDAYHSFDRSGRIDPLVAFALSFSISPVLELRNTSHGGCVQTTLLGVAIAIILALVVALVGPLFIDWSRYRAEFEARAAWAIGLDLRITGRIDARLLPTPTLTLQDIEFGRAGDGTTVRARALHIEYALGALVR